MYEKITPEGIKREILANMKTKLETCEGSFADVMAGPLAVELYKVYVGLNASIPMFYVDETSGEFLEKQAAWYGIVRKPGAKARVVLTIAGADGTSISAGSIFSTLDGLQFLTVSAAVLVNGNAAIEAEAAEAGTNYNVEAERITQQPVSIPGVTGVKSAAAQGGTDSETDASLMRRLDAYRKKPATSGNAYHYEQWAMKVPGVGAARVFPVSNAGGTVKVLVAGPDFCAVDTAVTVACAAYIEKMRPVCVGVTVESAAELAIDVGATLRLESRVTLEQIASVFQKSLRDYLQKTAMKSYEISYNRVAYMLLDIDGVTDYTVLTVNGGTENVILQQNEVPVIGEVILL